MAVVTTTFSSAVNDLWASPTWVSTDPSWKLDVELTNWVNTINDPNKISIIHDPGDATARGATDVVRWLLRCRESDTSSDYGFSFCAAYAGTSTLTTNSGSYKDRTAGSSNNGSGTYTIVTNTVDAVPTRGYAINYLTAYDAESATPWFAFATSHTPGGTTVYANLQILLRLNTANMAAGSYYPASGLGKWIYVVLASNSISSAGTPTFVTPQKSTAAPEYGVSTTASLRFPRPTINSYFFKLGAQYGDTHFLGEPTYDMLVSNGATGTWGDTVTLESKTYTRTAGGLWVRTA